MPLYKEDMKDLRCTCGHPGCEDPLYLHPKCHIEAPTWAKYFDGILTIECIECEQIIAEFAIASRDH